MSEDFSSTGYDDAVFISYTHVDNEPFGPEHQQWITLLHEQLTTRLQQLAGERLTVWRDEKLQGNDIFAETLVERLAKVAALVSVCSPLYLHSEWCQRELDEFIHAAEAGPGIQIGTKSRVFKVLKTPVPLDELPQPLSPLLGYSFYEELPGENHVREFLNNPSPTERWKFYARVDDLAQDIAALLRDLEEDDGEGAGLDADGPTVYLAETASDVAAYRDNLKRELERRGCEVLPRRPLPLTVEELTEAVKADLARSRLSINLLGARYGARPEAEDRSIPQLQLDLAGEEAARNGLEQLIWVPDGLESVDEPQAALIERLQLADVGEGVELVRTSLESFKAHTLDRIAPPPAPAPVAPEVSGATKRVYLVYDRDDREPAADLQRLLEARGHVVMLPLSEGAETEAREVHETSMVLSDAVLIYYGNATEHWLRMKLFDLVKAPGWGRTEPFQAKAVWVAPPQTPHKATYATAEALVLNAIDGSEPSALEPFLAQLASVGPGAVTS